MISFSFPTKKQILEADSESKTTGRDAQVFEPIPQQEEEEKRIEMLKSSKLNEKEDKDMMNLINNLKSIFDIRPIWLKSNIEVELASRGIKYPSDFSLKKALATVSYLIRNGPWKFTYAKFGYDPRKHKEAIEFQSFNIGIRNKNFMAESKAFDQYLSSNSEKRLKWLLISKRGISTLFNFVRFRIVL